MTTATPSAMPEDRESELYGLMNEVARTSLPEQRHKPQLLLTASNTIMPLIERPYKKRWR